jgi:putative hydrolase of the HAD superfamily
LKVSPADLERIIFEELSSRRASIGEIPEQAHWQAVADILKVDRREVMSIAREFFSGDRVDQVLVATLRSLHQEHKIGLISNAWSGLRRWIKRQGYGDVFDCMIISAEVGVMKPEPFIYEMALDELDARPEESVFIDDMLPNVEAARKLGMHAIHFKEREKTLEELSLLLSDPR